MKTTFLITTSLLILSSCVSTKKFKALEAKYNTCEESLSASNKKIQLCEVEKEKLQIKLGTNYTIIN